MGSWRICTGLFIILYTCCLSGQDADSSYRFSGVVYNASYQSMQGTHVINMRSHQGVITDELGGFYIQVQASDTLFIRNVAYRDTLVAVANTGPSHSIVLRVRYYSINEAKVFPWGSSYEDFREAMVETQVPQTLGESLGFKRQDPDYVPYDMNEAKLKSIGFMLTSPISYIYHNLSKKEKNRRKVYWLKRNKEKHGILDNILSPENLASVTGLSGDALLDFMVYLYERMVCDQKCSELDIYKEVYSHWEVYQALFPAD